MAKIASTLGCHTNPLVHLVFIVVALLKHARSARASPLMHEFVCVLKRFFCLFTLLNFYVVKHSHSSLLISFMNTEDIKTGYNNGWSVGSKSGAFHVRITCNVFKPTKSV